MGITFVYELPTKVGSKIRYPDFTILSEVDYKTTILIEHQGMLDQEIYRNHFKNRICDYWYAGYIQGVNIFFTFSRIDGSLDMEPILDIIQLKIRPWLQRDSFFTNQARAEDGDSPQ